MKKQDGGFQEFVIFCELFKNYFTNRYLIISCRALAREGDQEMMPLCACVRVCLGHAVCSETTIVTSKLLVLMNFFRSSILFGFGELWPTFVTMSNSTFT